MSVYNDASRVGRAIESIRGQTFTDWELIAINDGSSDQTQGVLEDYAAKDERVRVCEQENSGLTKALIRGCHLARGEYIARQDSDDWSEPLRLERQVGLLDANPALGFVSCTTRYVGPQDELLDIIQRPSNPEEATRGLREARMGPPAHGSVMFRASLYHQLGGYREEFYYGQDSDLWLRMAERAQIGYSPEMLYTARREMVSVSGSQQTLQRRFGELGQACKLARAARESEEPFLRQGRQLTARLRSSRHQGSLSDDGSRMEMAYLIGSQLATRRDRRACRYLWQVLRAKPWHWRAWVRFAQAGMFGKLRSTDHADRHADDLTMDGSPEVVTIDEPPCTSRASHPR